jgi:hypothetical protein
LVTHLAAESVKIGHFTKGSIDEKQDKQIDGQGPGK